MTDHAPAQVRFPALGTTAALLVTDPSALPLAESILRAELAAVELTCSRFRPDSELTRVNSTAGTPTTVSERFAEALQIALRAARITEGLVDPTVGSAVIAAATTAPSPRCASTILIPWPPLVPCPAGGGSLSTRTPADCACRRRPTRLRRHRKGSHRRSRGATGRCRHRERSAGQSRWRPGHSRAGTGRGWRIALADDHARPIPEHDHTIALTGGALATSGIGVRNWRRAGRTLHHIIDPVTGEPAAPVWRTVSVAAATCVDANAAGTAAIVLGDRAVDWLRGTALPARLTSLDGIVVRLGDWPPDAHPRTRGES